MNIEQLKNEKKKYDFYEFNNRRINEVYLKIRNVIVTFKKTFIMGFNNIYGQRKYFIGSHFGSYAAFGMATYNLYNIRQRIIKQAIQLTRSKRVWIIKTTSFYIGILYFIGLIAVWHIPSISCELGFHVFLGFSSATFNILTDQNKAMEMVLNPRRLELIKKKYKIQTNII